MTIDNIYKVSFENSWGRYYGFLRNEKKFNINDSVFVAYGNDKIFRGIIRGIELQDRLNPEIIYKIEIPRGLAYDFIEETDLTSLRMNCDHVFTSLEDAKESRIRQLNKMHDLELKRIERFFNQFKDETD